MKILLEIIQWNFTILPLTEVTYVKLVSLLLAFLAKFQVVLAEFLQGCMYSTEFFFLTMDSCKLEKLKGKKNKPKQNINCKNSQLRKMLRIVATKLFSVCYLLSFMFYKSHCYTTSNSTTVFDYCIASKKFLEIYFGKWYNFSSSGHAATNPSFRNYCLERKLAIALMLLPTGDEDCTGMYI